MKQNLTSYLPKSAISVGKNSIPPSKPKLPIVEVENKIKVLISVKAYSKISFLLQKISDVEWSALLFYTVKGHITDPDNMVCKVEDIYLMDKGTGAHTSHDYNDEDVAEAFETYPEYMDMKLGHIHSHNSMNVFFSSTDKDELLDNVSNHLYYLSLIVNNKGEMCAKVAYEGKQILKNKTTLKNKLGNWVTTSFSKPVEKNVMFVHECNIVLLIDKGASFLERFKKITTKPITVPTNYSTIPKKDTGFSWGDTEDMDSIPYSRTLPSSASKTPSSDILLAKALILCRTDDLGTFPIISTLLREVEQKFKGIGYDYIVESYESFYSQNEEGGGDNFIYSAYCEVYNKLKTDVITVDEITFAVENALKLIWGPVGEAIAEAVDNYLIDINMLAEEMDDDKLPDEPIKKSVKG